MADQPKISVITVSFNAGHLVERTIQSVLAQSYPNIEYLVIDGASKDDTVNYIEKYRDRLDYFISEPDESHFDAMNKGLKQSTGEYVLYMNAGDVIKDSTSLAEMMKGHQNADLVYGKANYIDEEGNTRPWHKTTPPSHKLSAKSFLNGMVICHHSMIVKKSIAPYYRLAPWKVSNDIDWAIRILKQAKSLHFYNKVFCLYLEGGISAKQRFQAVRERFQIAREHFGLVTAMLSQFSILFQIVKRGSIS